MGCTWVTGNDGKAGGSWGQLLISCANSQPKVVVSASGSQFIQQIIIKVKSVYSWACPSSAPACSLLLLIVADCRRIKHITNYISFTLLGQIGCLVLDSDMATMWPLGCAKKQKFVQIKPILGLWLSLYLKRHQKKFQEFRGFLCWVPSILSFG